MSKHVFNLYKSFTGSQRTALIFEKKNMVKGTVPLCQKRTETERFCVRNKDKTWTFWAEIGFSGTGLLFTFTLKWKIFVAKIKLVFG